ncbi:DUF2868 domain-containing protein [Ideonella sp.]|uniref:DUF2868 domain-containing protein n=1 Tax=Ideonella sp. TaxID=1929293 RepID=UPI0035B3D0C9
MPRPSNEIEGDDPSAIAPKGARWRFADLIDFELALDATSGADPARDRALFVERIAPALRHLASDRSAVFLAWLRASGAAADSPSAGALFERGLRAAGALAVAIGLLLGAATTAGLLSHDGPQPINAPLFLVWTVGLQVGIVVAALLAAAARAMGFRFTTLRGWMETLVRLMAGLAGRLNGERRMAVRQQLARVSARSGRLAPFVGLELMKLTQAFAIAFNLGILASMLLVYLPFLELRFGWQSTYSLGPEAVYQATQVIAAPWRWISDGLAPSRPQILATEFARGQSSLSLDPSAAHAWWPFLLCAVAFYGLTLRLMAAALMEGLLRWRLRRPAFNHPAANALWRRLQGPLIVSAGGNAELPAESPGAGTAHVRPQRVLAVRSDACALDDAQLTMLVQNHLGWKVDQIVTACIDDDRLGPELAAGLRTRPDAVAVVAPATQNPIVAIASFLRELSAAVQPGGEVVVLLAGDAGEAAPDASSMDERHRIWSRFVAIHRLGVGVERCR